MSDTHYTCKFDVDTKYTVICGNALIPNPNCPTGYTEVDSETCKNTFATQRPDQNTKPPIIRNKIGDIADTVFFSVIIVGFVLLILKKKIIKH